MVADMVDDMELDMLADMGATKNWHQHWHGNSICWECWSRGLVNWTQTFWPEAYPLAHLLKLCKFIFMGSILSKLLHKKIFLQCVFSCVSSNSLHDMMHSHIGCICFDFSPVCVFMGILKLSATLCICWIFLQCVFFICLLKLPVQDDA